jgi:hypothetical protein
MVGCAFELVAASGIAESHNLTGPRASLIDAISDIENAHHAFI